MSYWGHWLHQFEFRFDRRVNKTKTVRYSRSQVSFWLFRIILNSSEFFWIFLNPLNLSIYFRRTDFNNDFLTFKQDIDNLQGLLCTFMDNCFDKATTTEQVYVLIQRFKKLGISCIDDEIKLKWDVYCKLYLETMMKIKRDYEDCKTNDSWHVPQDWPRRPGIVRCMESWAQRITQPMNVLKKNAPHLVEPDYIKKNKASFNNFVRLL